MLGLRGTGTNVKASITSTTTTSSNDSGGLTTAGNLLGHFFFSVLALCCDLSFGCTMY